MEGRETAKDRFNLSEAEKRKRLQNVRRKLIQATPKTYAKKWSTVSGAAKWFFAFLVILLLYAIFEYFPRMQ